jgi:predicted acylesterase/phospholipase RssA
MHASFPTNPERRNYITSFITKALEDKKHEGLTKEKQDKIKKHWPMVLEKGEHRDLSEKTFEKIKKHWPQILEASDRCLIASRLSHLSEKISEACISSIYKNSELRINARNAKPVAAIAQCIESIWLKQKCEEYFFDLLDRIHSRPNFFKTPPINLTFKGGGSKAIAYGGALLELEKLGWLRDALRFAGTSAGSIVAMLCALKFTPQEIYEFLNDNNLYRAFISNPVSGISHKDFPSFGQGFKTMVKNPLSAYKVNKEGGLYEGERLRNWLKNKIKQKTGNEDCTFAELQELAEKEQVKDKKFGELYVFAVSLEDHSLHTFSHREEHYKHVAIFEAVYASCAFPGLLIPQIIVTRGPKPLNLGPFADGGALYNNPLTYFDNPPFLVGKEAFNKETLGLSLCDPTKFDKKDRALDLDEKLLKAPTLIGVGLAMKEIVDNTQETNLDMHKANRYRLIELSNQGVDLADIPPAEEKKQALHIGGQEITRAFAIDMELRNSRNEMKHMQFTWPESSSHVDVVVKASSLIGKQSETKKFMADLDIPEKIAKQKIKIISQTKGIEGRETGPGKNIITYNVNTIYYEGGVWDNVRFGNGKMIFADGTSYEGGWKEGKWHGKGKLIYANGTSYEGDWKEGKWHGKGKLILTDGSSREGDWIEEKLHGKGKMIFADGSSYEGDWKEGKYHGKGKAIFADGSSYEGDWNEEKFHGKGKLISADGSSYEGDWVNFVKHGKGKYCEPSTKTSYEGDWKAGKRDGIGKSTGPYGSYEGGWKEGVKHGKGIVILNASKHKKRKYTYKDGKLIK